VWGVVLMALMVVSFAPAGAEEAPSPPPAPLASDLVQVRLQFGLGPVAPRADLDAIAQRHSEEMAARGGAPFHSSDPGAGLSGWVRMGEVVGWADWPRTDWAEAFTNAFLESPTHRDVVLDADYDYIGVGAALSASGDIIYVSAVFLQPEAPPPSAAVPAPGACCAPSVDAGHAAASQSSATTTTTPASQARAASVAHATTPHLPSPVTVRALAAADRRGVQPLMALLVGAMLIAALVPLGRKRS
jgi:hypothetical protein